VHGFGVTIDCEYYRNVRPGDRINIWNRVLGIEEKHSKFSGKLAMQYLESTYTNQRDEVVCRALGLTARHERKASREKNKYKDVKTYVYTDAERDAIDEKVMTEPQRIRGANTRYWDDVKSATRSTRSCAAAVDVGHHGVRDASGRGAAHGALLKHAARHPAHYIRNKEGGGGVEYTGIGHHREDFAKKVGVPGMYDYLPQRASWFVSAITNWMGDDGVIKRIRMEARKFNLQGDTTFINGKVVKKYLKDRCPLVDIEMTGINQSGVLSSPALRRSCCRRKTSTRAFLSTVRWSISNCRRYARKPRRERHGHQCAVSRVRHDQRSRARRRAQQEELRAGTRTPQDRGEYGYRDRQGARGWCENRLRTRGFLGRLPRMPAELAPLSGREKGRHVQARQLGHRSASRASTAGGRF
jgi:hypothetical protein